MSKFQQRPETGTLFKNHEKRGDSSPDYKGEALVGDMPYWVSAWVKESSKGTKFLSLSFRPKTESNRAPAKNQQAAPPDSDPFTDDIPLAPHERGSIA